MATPQRKDDHIKFSLEKDVQCKISAGFEDVDLVHSSLPEIDYDEISTSIEMFGRHMDYPFIISAITGGSKQAQKINADLAALAERFKIGISVGSQRAMLEDSKLRSTYEVRSYAPNALLFSNLGIAQIIGMETSTIAELVESIEADALAVHLNPLQEVLQPEGDRNFKGGIEKLKILKRELKCPIIAKETGAGISYEISKKLSFLDGVEIAGVGGTSFAAVEYYRVKDEVNKQSTKLFWDWGIPSVISLVETNEMFNNIIASGGIRNGVHVAKSLVLGANCAGLAKPFLSAVYNKKADASETYVNKLINELKTTMFLTGAADIADLSTRPAVITGKVKEYLDQRGFNLDRFSRRSY